MNGYDWERVRSAVRDVERTVVELGEAVDAIQDPAAPAVYLHVIKARNGVEQWTVLCTGIDCASELGRWPMTTEGMDAAKAAAREHEHN